MEKNVDIIARLAQVVQENTRTNRANFEYDTAELKKAAKETRLENRSFFWMSRPSGTWCLKERNVFLQGTHSHALWTHYDTYNEWIKAFRVVVKGEKDGRIMGDIYPLNFDEHLHRVQAAALPIYTVTGRCGDGTVFAMPYTSFTQLDAQIWIFKAGGIKEIRYAPENEAELAARLMQEHHIEVHGQSKKTQADQQAEKCVSR